MVLNHTSFNLSELHHQKHQKYAENYVKALTKLNEIVEKAVNLAGELESLGLHEHGQKILNMVGEIKVADVLPAVNCSASNNHTNDTGHKSQSAIGNIMCRFCGQVMSGPIAEHYLNKHSKAIRGVIVSFAARRDFFTVEEFCRELEIPVEDGKVLLNAFVADGALSHKDDENTFRLKNPVESLFD